VNLASRARFWRRTAAALVVVTLAGACGGATPSQTPSASPSKAAPSAAPSVATKSIAPSIAPSPTPSAPLMPISVVAATSCDPSVVPGAAFPPADPVPSSKATPFMLRVPILEYHRVVPVAEAGNSLPGLTMPPEVFDAQMAALHKAGWHTITLATLADDLTAETTPPARTFVVTVDDGWWDSYDYVYPTLQKYGYVATFFVIAGRIGRPNFMGPSQIRVLLAGGNEIADHTVTHAVLTAAQPKALTYEIDAAAATIAAVTGRWPETLAYPHGKADSRAITAVAACKSMRMAVMEGNGGRETWSGRFRVSRIQVGSKRPAADLLAQVQREGR